MKTILIKNKFWVDPYIRKLSITEKVLFLYLIANEHKNLIGCYEITEDQICFELSIMPNQFRESIQKFQKDHKFIYYEDHIVIINNFKHNRNLLNNVKLKKAIENQIEELPENLSKLVRELMKVNINHKTIKFLTQETENPLQLKISDDSSMSHTYDIDNINNNSNNNSNNNKLEENVDNFKTETKVSELNSVKVKNIKSAAEVIQEKLETMKNNSEKEAKPTRIKERFQEVALDWANYFEMNKSHKTRLFGLFKQYGEDYMVRICNLASNDRTKMPKTPIHYILWHIKHQKENK